MDTVEQERLLLLNSLYTGHFLVAWAMLLNLLHLAFFHDRVSFVGVVFGALALLMAWLLPASTKRARVVGAAIGFTILSWVVALVAI